MSYVLKCDNKSSLSSNVDPVAAAAAFKNQKLRTGGSLGRQRSQKFPELKKKNSFLHSLVVVCKHGNRNQKKR